MRIQNIRDSKELQKYCDKKGREGMYQEALALAKEILDDEKSPQQVMALVGEMKALAIGSKCDGYWNEKVEHGYYRFINKASYQNDKTTNNHTKD